MKQLFIVLLVAASFPLFAQTGKLYLADSSSSQPLIVGLGGSEGGNAWASNHWKPVRDQFLQKGYAFLALGYFKTKGAPDTLNKIAIDSVYAAIMEAAKDPRINKKKIAIIGGSRGGDLALLLGSYYKNISCVVAIVPSHAVFPGNTTHFTTSSWTYKGKELPFIPVNEEAVPYMRQGNLRAAFEAMLKDSLAEQKALIKVEKVRGPILLLSATRDQVAPTTPMCEKIAGRLKAHRFKYPYEHIAIEGLHGEPLKHFDKVFSFFEEHFKH